MVQKISPSSQSPIQQIQPVIPHDVKQADVKESGQKHHETKDRFDSKSNDNVQKTNVLPKLPDMVARITPERFPAGEKLFEDIFGKGNIEFHYDTKYGRFAAHTKIAKDIAKEFTGDPDNQYLYIYFEDPNGVVDIPTKTPKVKGSLLIDEGADTQLQVFHNEEQNRADFFFVDSDNNVVQQLAVQDGQITYLNLGEEGGGATRSTSHKGTENENLNESYREITGVEPEFQRIP